ncbi:MAG: MCE family protein [Carbonactinosporaceae bacterium]
MMTSRTPRVLAAISVLVLVVAGAWVLRPMDDMVQVSARFPTTVSVYPGSDVRVLGIPVGTVTEVTPQGTSVRVEMEYDAEHPVPAAAKAAIVTPAIVSDRYIQLAPVYNGGPTLEDGANIPPKRTAVPVELDRIYGSLNQMTKALGPRGANRNGALSRLLDVGADNLKGQGAQMNQTFEDFSMAVDTLSSTRGDFFGSVRNLQVFTSALAESDEQVRVFNQDLADVSAQLEAEREELRAALRNLAIALAQIAEFVHNNKDILKRDLDKLTEITAILVRQQRSLEEFMDVAPTALSNLKNAYNPSSGTLDTRDNMQQTESDPGLVLCGYLHALGERDIPCSKLRTLFQQMHNGGGGGAPQLGSEAPDGDLGGMLGVEER